MYARKAIFRMWIVQNRVFLRATPWSFRLFKELHDKFFILEENWEIKTTFLGLKFSEFWIWKTQLGNNFTTTLKNVQHPIELRELVGNKQLPMSKPHLSLKHNKSFKFLRFCIMVPLWMNLGRALCDLKYIVR